MRGQSRFVNRVAAIWRLLMLAGVLGLYLGSVAVSGRELGDGYGGAFGVTLASAGGAGTILAKAVRTGDDTPLLLYIMILLVAAAAAVLVWSIIKTKDRRKGRKNPPKSPQGNPRTGQAPRRGGEGVNPNENQGQAPRMGGQPREGQSPRTRAQDPRYQGNRNAGGQDMPQGQRMDRNPGETPDPDEFIPNQGEQRPRTRSRRRPEE